MHIFWIRTESTWCLLQTLIFINVTLKNFGNVVDSYLAESGKSVLKTICTIACFRLRHFVFYLVKFWDILRGPQKFETIFHFVLTLLSNVKKCGRLFQILWPSHNIWTLLRMTSFMDSTLVYSFYQLSFKSIFQYCGYR